MPHVTFVAPACSPDTRIAHIERLKRETFDVLVLGGGINGAGVARDLLLRGGGLRVALVEQRQFSSGTSGKNSQLIHGGLRYLKYLEFGLVREALRERATLLRLAPHLVEPLPFLMPLKGWIRRAYYGFGLTLYDALAGRHGLERHRRLARSEVERLEPGLAREGLSGAARFYDCRVHSARFTLANVWDAVRRGAAAVNYCRAETWTRGADGWRVRMRDRLSGETFEARARKLVDTTGPWSVAGELRLVRGSHIVLPRLTSSGDAIAYFDERGRIVFVIPWGEDRQLSLVGTTDVDHGGGPDEVKISAEELDYLLGIVRRLFPASRPEPISAFSSLRPLVRDERHSPTATSREHRIWNSPDGILHVAGGKYTTYRVMSEQAGDAVCKEIAPTTAGVHRTAETPLDGNSAETVDALFSQAREIASRHQIAEEEARKLIALYGVQTGVLLDLLPETPPPGVARAEAARIAYAVRHEMAMRLVDLMFVSTYWGYERQWDRDRLAPYALAMGNLLCWDERQIEEELKLVLCLSEAPGSKLAGPARER